MAHKLIALSGVFGFLAVGLGAFGAHGLQARLAVVPDGAKRLDWWNTAAQYNLPHALAIALAAWLVSRDAGVTGSLAGGCFAAGIVFFCGSLYWMAFTGQSRLAMVTPLGGVLLLVGWACVVVAGFRIGARAI